MTTARIELATYCLGDSGSILLSYVAKVQYNSIILLLIVPNFFNIQMKKDYVFLVLLLFFHLPEQMVAKLKSLLSHLPLLKLMPSSHN